MEGHTGSQKLLAKLKNWVRFPRMSSIVQGVVGSCGKCFAFNAPHSRLSTLVPIAKSLIPTKPLEIISIDNQGMIKDGNSKTYYLHTAICCFTRYAWIQASNNNRPTSMFQFLLQRVFLQFGNPEIVVSDFGQDVQSKLTNNLYKQLGITRKMTTPYHPAGNVAS